jgi:putative tryptophan/tyrosine transport system substrate-binding protein
MIPLGEDQMLVGIGRRQFISALGGAALAWPLAARAQQSNKLPTVGVLLGNASSWRAWTAAFVQRLSQLGWIEGRTVAIEYRWSDERPEHVAKFAAELVQQKVDVILTYGGAVATLKQATPSIPIVFALATDPLGSGLVASLARPAGNVTGLSLEATDIAGKRLDLLREAVPRLHQLAIMYDAGYPATVREMGEVTSAARPLSLEVAPHGIRRAEDIAPAFDALKPQADVLYVAVDHLVLANIAQIAALALSVRLPTVFPDRSNIQAGGFMSYGPSIPTLFRRTAEYVDKILRGAKPSDLPVEQPTKFELVINLKTAKELGLTIPQTLLVAADEVVE